MGGTVEGGSSDSYYGIRSKPITETVFLEKEKLELRKKKIKELKKFNFNYYFYKLIKFFKK